MSVLYKPPRSAGKPMLDCVVRAEAPQTGSEISKFLCVCPLDVIFQELAVYGSPDSRVDRLLAAIAVYPEGLERCLPDDWWDKLLEDLEGGRDLSRAINALAIIQCVLHYVPSSIGFLNDKFRYQVFRYLDSEDDIAARRALGAADELVRGLPDEATDEELKRMCDEYGLILMGDEGLFEDQIRVLPFFCEIMRIRSPEQVFQFLDPDMIESMLRIAVQRADIDGEVLGEAASVCGEDFVREKLLDLLSVSSGESS
jgi:hypothetical protein